MNVKLGWSAEIDGSWTKMDIDVEEVDLQTFLVEKGIDPTANITVSEKFVLLYLLGEIFVLSHKITAYPDIFSGERDELKKLIQRRDKTVEGIKNRV